MRHALVATARHVKPQRTPRRVGPTRGVHWVHFVVTEARLAERGGKSRNDGVDGNVKRSRRLGRGRSHEAEATLPSGLCLHPHRARR